MPFTKLMNSWNSKNMLTKIPFTFHEALFDVIISLNSRDTFILLLNQGNITYYR